MAASFSTDDPSALLQAFRAGIKSGQIKRWAAVAPTSGDVSHTDEFLFGKAWFRPKASGGELTFNIVRGQGSPLEKGLYSHYHAQLIETFLQHFGPSFSRVTATAVAGAGDVV
jgi:hypothetical protein